MKYNELAVRRQKKSNRKGRGIAAGRGMTAGRGTKGQGARKSGGVRPGFEGGQMPLYMRIPKLRGFKSHRDTIENVYTGQLAAIKKVIIDNQTLFEAGLASSPFVSVKLLFNADVSDKKDVKLQGASQNAVKALAKAGGSFSQVDRQSRPKQKIVKKTED